MVCVLLMILVGCGKRNDDSRRELRTYPNGMVKETTNLLDGDSSVCEIKYWANGVLKSYTIRKQDSVVYSANYDKYSQCINTSGTWVLFHDRVDKSVLGRYRLRFTFYPRVGYKRTLTVNDNESNFIGSILNFPDNKIEFDTIITYEGVPKDTLTLYFGHMDTTTRKAITTYFHTW